MRFTRQPYGLPLNDKKFVVNLVYYILCLKPSSRHKFYLLCSKRGIKHKTTAPYTPQTNGQVERFNRTLKEATIQKYHYDDIPQAVIHLDDFIIAYNVGKKLSALKRKKPMQFILNKFEENPIFFNINLNHLLLGFNS